MTEFHCISGNLNTQQANAENIFSTKPFSVTVNVLKNIKE